MKLKNTKSKPIRKKNALLQQSLCDYPIKQIPSSIFFFNLEEKINSKTLNSTYILSPLIPPTSSPPLSKFSAFQLANKKGSAPEAMLPAKSRKASKGKEVKKCASEQQYQECLAVPDCLAQATKTLSVILCQTTHLDQSLAACSI